LPDLSGRIDAPDLHRGGLGDRDATGEGTKQEHSHDPLNEFHVRFLSWF
jgi:hypothetical protein